MGRDTLGSVPIRSEEDPGALDIRLTLPLIGRGLPCGYEHAHLVSSVQLPSLPASTVPRAYPLGTVRRLGALRGNNVSNDSIGQHSRYAEMSNVFI